MTDDTPPDPLRAYQEAAALTATADGGYPLLLDLSLDLAVAGGRLCAAASAPADEVLVRAGDVLWAWARLLDTARVEAALFTGLVGAARAATLDLQVKRCCAEVAAWSGNLAHRIGQVTFPEEEARRFAAVRAVAGGAGPVVVSLAQTVDAAGSHLFDVAADDLARRAE